jgi:glutamate dehydrogenase
VKAFRIARDVSGAIPRWRAVEALASEVAQGLWTELMTGADRVVGSLTRRYLARLPKASIGEAVAADMGGFSDFEQSLPESGPAEWQKAHEAEEYEMVEAGVPDDVARRYAYRRQLVHAPDAIELANRFERPVSDVAEIMFQGGQEVGLDRLETLGSGYNFTDSWQRWALEALEDDLVWLRRRLAERILEDGGQASPSEAVSNFLAANALPVERLGRFVDGLGTDPPDNLAPLMIGVRQLRALLG